jgi:hypothetical protein
VPLLRRLPLALALACATARVATAQRVHLIAVSGLSGEPAYRLAFESATSTLADSARARWQVPDSSVVVLVFLVGHGSGEGADSRVSLPGPDATAADFAGWLAGFARQTVVFVNASSGSGDFVGALAGKRRVIVTATRTAFERNESRFAAPFVRGLTSDEADADKDGRVSVFEAFAYARKEVARAYEIDHAMQTEHAVLSDSALARSVSFGAHRGTANPRAAALVAERAELEEKVAALRSRKDAMPPAAYEAELERLLVQVAEKTQAIRALERAP